MRGLLNYTPNRHLPTGLCSRDGVVGTRTKSTPNGISRKGWTEFLVFSFSFLPRSSEYGSDLQRNLCRDYVPTDCLLIRCSKVFTSSEKQGLFIDEQLPTKKPKKKFNDSPFDLTIIYRIMCRFPKPFKLEEDDFLKPL